MEKNDNEKNNYFSKHIKTTNVLLLSITGKLNKIIDNEKYKRKIKDILVLIIKKEKDKLKKVCFEGLPDDLPLLRSLIWKINLRYLSFDVDKWIEYILKKHIEYEEIKEVFILKMQLQRELYEELDQVNNPELPVNTLRNNKINELNKFIKNTDKQLLEEIDKDVRRTHTDLNFFFMPSKSEDLKCLTDGQIREELDRRRNSDVKKIDDIYINTVGDKFETHADVLCRILYIYAKLNPDIIYVQGMNEILAVIYYCFSCDRHLNITNTNLEADTFWCFSYLMEDIKLIFMKDKDDSREGIFKKIEFLKEMIKIIDKEIYEHLQNNGVELSHFAFRWIILLFTQDFILPDVIRLWDTILSERDRFFYVFYISLAIIKIKKNKILSSDFSNIILNLQNLEDLNTEIILIEVNKLKNKFDKKIKKLFESFSKENKISK